MIEFALCQELEINKDARARQKLQKPFCLWLTGLSGAGKSTIANLLDKQLFASGKHTYVLDGDNIRHGLNQDLGFSDPDRVENMRRVMEVARLFVDAGLVVMVACISPYRAERDLARSRFAPDEFVEIYVDASLEECERRDPKGLYAKARRGELLHFTGIDSDYEAPESPEIRLDTVRKNPDECVDLILSYLYTQALHEAGARMAESCNCRWLTELLPAVHALACKAGSAIMAIYQDLHPLVEYKPDHSPVTQADLEAHRILETGLSGIAPHWPVVSEESAQVPFDERRSWRYFWMVDPLDGTQEFLHRTGEFTVNIALIKDDRPVLGVVYAPVMDKLYFAVRGAGCYRMDGNLARPISVASRSGDDRRFVLSRRHASEQIQSMEQRKTGRYIVMGSSLKFCLIAEGAADVYPREGPTMEWDTAAAQCILEEAGGCVTDVAGNSIRYNKPSLLNSPFVASASR